MFAVLRKRSHVGAVWCGPFELTLGAGCERPSGTVGESMVAGTQHDEIWQMGLTIVGVFDDVVGVPELDVALTSGEYTCVAASRYQCFSLLGGGIASSFGDVCWIAV